MHKGRVNDVTHCYNWGRWGKKRVDFESAIVLASLCQGKKSYCHQYSLKHCFKHANRIELYTSVDDWRSRQSPASKDSHFIPTDLCGFDWQTHSTRKAESLPRLCYSSPKSKPTFLPHDRVKMMRGCISTMKWFNKLTWILCWMQCSWLQTR